MTRRIAPELLQRRRVRFRDTIDGPEKCCTQCGEWWPATPEFFNPSPRAANGLHAWCKCCHREGARAPEPPPAPVPEVFTAMRWRPCT